MIEKKGSDWRLWFQGCNSHPWIKDMNQGCESNKGGDFLTAILTFRGSWSEFNHSINRLYVKDRSSKMLKRIKIFVKFLDKFLVFHDILVLIMGKSHFKSYFHDFDFLFLIMVMVFSGCLLWWNKKTSSRSKLYSKTHTSESHPCHSHPS